MPRSHNEKHLTIGQRLKRLTAGTTLAAIGVLSLSACGDEVAADKPAATATATPGETAPETATETPATTETEAPTTTSSPEPTPTETEQAPQLTAIERVTNTEAYLAYTSGLTPENLAQLSTEQEVREAFRITADKLPKTDAAGNPISIPEAYAVFFIAAREGYQNAGSTPEEVSSFDATVDTEGYINYVNTKYTVPALDELDGTGDQYNPEYNNYYYIQQMTIGYLYRSGDMNEPYRLSVTPETINVTEDGDGTTNNFSVEVTFTTKELYDEHAAIYIGGYSKERREFVDGGVLQNVIADPATGALKPTAIENYDIVASN